MSAEMAAIPESPEVIETAAEALRVLYKRAAATDAETDYEAMMEGLLALGLNEARATRVSILWAVSLVGPHRHKFHLEDPDSRITLENADGTPPEPETLAVQAVLNQVLRENFEGAALTYQRFSMYHAKRVVDFLQLLLAVSCGGG